MSTTWSEYYKELDDTDKSDYKKKLTLANDKILPDPYFITDWEELEKVTSIPDIDFPVIYSYLVDTPSVYTKESIKAYKSLDAYNFFISGHVQDVPRFSKN